MAPSDHSSLVFFDVEEKYPYLYRRYRKPTEALPIALREARDNKSFVNKLENYYKKQRGIYKDTSDTSVKSKKKVIEQNVAEICDAVNITISSQQGKLKKKSSKNIDVIVSNQILNETEEDEDDQRFSFEEAKFSALNILAQVAKYLDNCDKLLGDFESSSKEKLKKGSSKKDILNSIYAKIDPSRKKVDQVVNSNLPEHLIDLLNQTYIDLIKNTQYRYREWQTQTYKDIYSGSSVKNIDSGIFSAPQTAMSGLYLTPETAPESKHKVSRLGPSRSNISALQVKSSKDSGMTSDGDAPHIIAYRRETKLPQYLVPKAKTRYEKLLSHEKGEKKLMKNLGSSFQRLNISKVEQIISEKEDLEEVPVPPVNQQMISFAISSKACHEKGWVKQPSFLDDPEQHTLLAWARARLQEAMKEREKEEADENFNSTRLLVRYYGDTKRDIAIKYKHGTALAKKLHEQENERKHLFMIALPDGSNIVFYPSGKCAILSIPIGSGKPGNYTIVYQNNDNNQIIGYFTPTGRGVCYHPNGNVGFLSTTKFGSCQDESGGLINKWIWSTQKLTPPLCIQFNKHMLFRCTSKTSMLLTFSMKGESFKLKLGSTTGAEEPILSEMGKLQTKQNFVSSIAIQLSKSLPSKKKEDKNRLKKERDGLHQMKSSSGLSEDLLEKRMRDLELKFPEEIKEQKMNTPYQLELYTLQRKFKETISKWLEHYRIATGLASPTKSRQYRKNISRSAVAFSSWSPTLKDKHALRVPSAPPVNRQYKSCGVKSRPFSSMPYGSLKKEEIKELQIKNSDVIKRSSSPDGEELESTSSKIPFKCGFVKEASKSPVLPKEGCPVALRAQILGGKNCMCRCDKRKVPLLTDTEFDDFLHVLPKTQLVVISIISSSAQYTNPADSILEKLYRQFNKNRTFPCTQSHHDPYRLFRYIVPSDCSGSDLSSLVERHNVIPGMFMMYQGGKLLFADYIFDGYGNSRTDFLKQISRTRKEALKGRFLPPDFRFSPTRARRGPRTTWGKDIGSPIGEYTSQTGEDEIERVPVKISVTTDGGGSCEDEIRRTPTPDMSTERSSNTLTSHGRSSIHVPSELSRDFFDKKMKQKNLAKRTNDTKQTPLASLTPSGGISQKKLAMKT